MKKAVKFVIVAGLFAGLAMLFTGIEGYAMDAMPFEACAGLSLGGLGLTAVCGRLGCELLD